jgi:hypothetical protein
MPAKDIFHDCFKAALIKDGWDITNDPYNLKVGKKDLFIDLGAENYWLLTKELRRSPLKSKVLSVLQKLETSKLPWVNMFFIKTY